MGALAAPTLPWTARFSVRSSPQAVAAVRGDAEAAAVDVDGEPVGFLPYQRGACGLRAWDFTQVVASQTAVRACTFGGGDFALHGSVQGF